VHINTYLRNLSLLIIATISFGFQSLQAQDDDVMFLGATYVSGGAYGMAFFTSSESFYSEWDVALFPDEQAVSGADFSINNAFGSHIGFLFYDNVGIGINWGISLFNTKVNASQWTGRFGVEVPIKLAPIDAIPIHILPFWENMRVNEVAGSQRYGVNLLATIQFLDPLLILVEGGIYTSTLTNKKENNGGIDETIEGGTGYNILVSVGFNFN